MKFKWIFYQILILYLLVIIHFGGVTLILVSFVLKIYCSSCRDLQPDQIWRGTKEGFSCKNQFCKIHCEIISRSLRGHSEVIGCALDHNNQDLQVFKIWALGDPSGSIRVACQRCRMKLKTWNIHFGGPIFFLGNEKKYFFFENRKIIFFFKIEK